MIRLEQSVAQSELPGRLKTLMLLRVIFVTLFLGASIFVEVKQARTYFGYIQTTHYLLIGTIYLISIGYVFVLRHARSLLWFAYLQLLLDSVFVTAIIYTTGGIESIFSFLYVLTIINGSIILYRRGGMITASACSILYGLLIDLQYYGVVHPLGSRHYDPDYQGSYLFFLVLVNIVGFYLVAFLSSFLAEQVRRSRVELRAKQRDIDNLEILNQSIINSMSSALVVVNGDNRTLLFNPAAEEILGISAARAHGQQIDECLPFMGEHLPKLGLSGGHPPPKPPPFLDFPLHRANGETRHLQLSVSPLRLVAGEQRGHLLIFQDLTEVKQIEAEMKKVEGLALVGELAAGIAHEIRNPMASISGSIQMLRENLEEDDVNVRLMDIVSREISRLNNLVNDFLLFARPRQVDTQEFEVNQLIHESLELFQNSPHWTHKITIAAELNEPIVVESDPEQLKQTFWNLFLNSCEAMTQGGTLHVATKRIPNGTHPDPEAVAISVRDTGAGFEESTLEHLFTPFFTTKEQGSGLGLAIVKRIVERLQGEVEGRNHPEGGAEITISLPLEFPRHNPMQSASSGHH